MLIIGLPHPRALRDKLGGSTVENLVRHAMVPVLSVRNGVSAPYRSIAVGVDFSQPARHAVDRALALFPDCSFTTVHAYNIGFVGTVAPGSAIAA